MCYKQEFEEIGLTLINDVLDNTGILMEYDTFKRTFDLKINFVDYYSLIHSIPRSYRIILSTNKKKLKGGETVQKVYAKLLIMKKVCRQSYWTLMNTIKVKRDYTNKWSDCLNEAITPVIMLDFYCLNFEACMDNKLRTFQFKILQRLLRTISS